MRVLICLILGASVLGCATVRRDIYFHDVKTKPYKTVSTRQMNSSSSGERIKIGDEEYVTITVGAKNSAVGTYALGIILPIIPVFWWPSEKFSLSKHEKLTIVCSVVYGTGRQFLEPRPEGNFHITKEGAAILKKRWDAQGDFCVDVSLILSDGTELKPIDKQSWEGQTKPQFFVFDVMAADLKSFKVKVSKIQLLSGSTVATTLEDDFVYDSWTRYHLFSPL